MFAVRTRENELIASLSQADATRVEQVCERMVGVNRTAFARAYEKHPRQTAWDGLQLFLVGGGTRIECIRQRLSRRPWVHLDRDPPVVDPGHPDDLYELSGQPYAGEPTFLLVAYGLSHVAADIPTIVSPREISVFNPQLPRLELDH